MLDSQRPILVIIINSNPVAISLAQLVRRSCTSSWPTTRAPSSRCSAFIGRDDHLMCRAANDCLDQLLVRPSVSPAHVEWLRGLSPWQREILGALNPSDWLRWTQAVPLGLASAEGEGGSDIEQPFNQCFEVRGTRLTRADLRQAFEQYGVVSGVEGPLEDGSWRVSMSELSGGTTALDKSTWIKVNEAPLWVSRDRRFARREPRDCLNELLRRPETTRGHAVWLRALSPWQRELLGAGSRLWERWLRFVPLTTTDPSPRIDIEQPFNQCFEVTGTRLLRADIVAQFGSWGQVAHIEGPLQDDSFRVVMATVGGGNSALDKSSWACVNGQPLCVSRDRRYVNRTPRDCLVELAARSGVTSAHVAWLRQLSPWQRELLGPVESGVWDRWMRSVPVGLQRTVNCYFEVRGNVLTREDLSQTFGNWGVVASVDGPNPDGSWRVVMAEDSAAQIALLRSTWTLLNGAPLSVSRDPRQPSRTPRDCLEELLARPGVTPAHQAWLRQLSPWQRALLGPIESRVWDSWMRSAPVRAWQPKPELRPEPKASGLMRLPFAASATAVDRRKLTVIGGTAESVRDAFVRFGEITELVPASGATFVTMATEAEALRAIAGSTLLTLGGVVKVSLDAVEPAQVDDGLVKLLSRGLGPREVARIVALTPVQRSWLALDDALWQQWLEQFRPTVVAPAPKRQSEWAPALKDSVRPEKRRTLVVRLCPPETLKQLFNEFGRVKEVRVSRLDAFVELSTQEEMLRALRESTWLELDGRPLRARPTAEAEARSARDGLAELVKRPETTELRERWLSELSGWQREGLAEDDALWQQWLEHVPATAAPSRARSAPPAPVQQQREREWTPPLKAGIIADKRRTLCVRSDSSASALKAFFGRFGQVDEVTEGGAYKFVVMHEEADSLRAFYESTWTEFGSGPLWLGIPRAAEARGPNDVNWASFNVGQRRGRWLRGLSGWQREALAEDQALWQQWLAHVPDD